MAAKRTAAAALAVVAVAVAVVLSGRPGVPEGPPPAAVTEARSPSPGTHPENCAEAAADHQQTLYADEIEKAANWGSVTDTLKVEIYSVSSDCKDEVTRARRQPLSGPLAPCVRLARKLEKQRRTEFPTFNPKASSPTPQTPTEKKLTHCEDLANRYSPD